MPIGIGSFNGRVTVTSSSLSFATSVVGASVFGTIGVFAERSVLSVTWGGVAASAIGQLNPSPESAGFTATAYVVPNPVTGNIIITGISSGQLVAHWMYHTGVYGLDPVAPVVNSAASALSITTSLTPQTLDSWMLLYGAARDVPGSGIAAGTGATKRGSDTDDNQLFDNNAAINPLALTSMQVTQVSTASIGAIAWAIAPTAPISATNFFTLIGVGI